ncbi:MAG: AMP-binding protein [Caldilineaceae bacterium]
MVFTSPFPDVAIPEVPLTQFLFAGAATRRQARLNRRSDRPDAHLWAARGRHPPGCRQPGRRGLKKGDVFAIYSPNLPEYAVAFHAVASLGAINTTVNPLYTAHELANQLRDAGARFLLTIPQFLPNALAAAEEVGGIEEIFVFGEAEGATPFASLLKSDGQVPPVEINPKEDLVVLPYSSGTTGFPKGVMLTHYNLVANIAQCVATPSSPENEVRESDIVLGLLPFYHIYGMVVIMSWALYKGRLWSRCALTWSSSWGPCRSTRSPTPSSSRRSSWGSPSIPS